MIGRGRLEDIACGVLETQPCSNFLSWFVLSYWD